MPDSLIPEHEPLRAVAFHALGRLATVMNRDFTRVDWQGPCSEWLAEVTECCTDERPPCILIRAAGACKRFMCNIGSNAIVDPITKAWVIALLRGTQLRLAHAPSAADDTTANVLLTLLGNIFALAADSVKRDLAADFNCNYFLVLTALEHAVTTQNPRQCLLIEGAFHGISGMLSFLKKFESADAGTGLAPYMQSTLAILERILYTVALDSEQLRLGLEILYSLLELCQRDRFAEPWNTALRHLREVPFYQVALGRARSEGLPERKELFSLLDLPLPLEQTSSSRSSGPASGMFGGTVGSSSSS